MMLTLSVIDGQRQISGSVSFLQWVWACISVSVGSERNSTLRQNRVARKFMKGGRNN